MNEQGHDWRSVHLFRKTRAFVSEPRRHLVRVRHSNQGSFHALLKTAENRIAPTTAVKKP